MGKEEFTEDIGAEARRKEPTRKTKIYLGGKY
jgi:hypothetical protein